MEGGCPFFFPVEASSATTPNRCAASLFPAQMGDSSASGDGSGIHRLISVEMTMFQTIFLKVPQVKTTMKHMLILVNGRTMEH